MKRMSCLVAFVFIGFFHNLTVQLFIVFPSLAKYSFLGSLSLFLLTLVTGILCILSYTCSVFGSPGFVSQDRVFDENDIFHPRNNRFCSKCKVFKPLRAHHCSHCRKCVEQMDHHCYWTNNCVGRRNHKQFILFLTYTVLLSLMSFVIDLLWTILYFVPQIQAQTTFLSKVAHSLQIAYLSPSFVYCLIFLVESARILGSQFDIIATNITTIEALNPKSYLVRSLARQGIEQHKFDRGSWLQNVKWFMGDKILLWWIPLNLSMPTSLFPIHTTPSDVESSDSQSSNSTQQDLRDVSRLPLDLELEDEVESDALAAQVMWLEKERTRMGISFDNERVASDSSGQSKGHRSQRTRTNRKRRRQLEVQRRAMADSSSSGT